MNRDKYYGLTQHQIGKLQTDKERWDDLQRRADIEEESIRNGD